MEVGPLRAKSERAEAVQECRESRRRTAFLRREFVRGDEERRQHRLLLEPRGEPCRGIRDPRGRDHFADPRWFGEQPHPERPDGSGRLCPHPNEMAGILSYDRTQRRRAFAVGDRDDGPHKVLGDEREDGSDGLAPLTRKASAISQEDSQTELRSLRATERPGAVSPLAGLRVRPGQHGRVRGGNPEPRRAESNAASRKDVGGPNGSMSTKSARTDFNAVVTSPVRTAASIPLRRRFSRINWPAVTDQSLSVMWTTGASIAMRIPHAPVAARPSRTDLSGCGHRARTIALRSRLIAIVGL